jgi:hypothetical protein
MDVSIQQRKQVMQGVKSGRVAVVNLAEKGTDQLS